jgi:hypothetical protein
MKFSNRKGETVNIDLSANGEFNEPILAQSGAGQSFISTSTDDLKNLSKEDGKAILANTGAKIITK